jgi:DNA-binding PucR family transcriptional regulator
MDKHIFSQCTDTGLLAASVHPDLLRLLEYDRTSGTEYTHTLRLYLSNNRNAAAAAAELHIHRSTFFYRLGKMEELFDIQINSGKDLFAYEYSFRVLDYLKGQKK